VTKDRLLRKYLLLPFLRLFRNHTARRVLWWVIFFLFSFIILGANFIPDQVVLETGEVAKKDVYYNGGVVTYTSEIKTAEARAKAAQEVPQIFQMNHQVLNNLELGVEDFFVAVSTIKNDANLDETAKMEKLKGLLPESVPQESLSALLDADQETVAMLETELKGIIRTRMQDGVTKDQLESVQRRIINDVEALDLKSSFKVCLRGIVNQLKFEPNKIYDPVTTAQEVESKLAQVKPVQVTIQPGEKIVEKGAVTTPEQIEALKYLGLQRANTPFPTFVGLFGFIAIVYVLIIVYIRGYKPELQKQESNIVLLGLLINVSLIIAKIVTSIHISDRPEFASQLGYAIPIAASSMLAAILFDVRTAVFITVVLGLFIGVITNGQMIYVTVAIVGGLVGIYRVANLSQRSHLVRASIDIGLVSALTVGVLGLMWNQSMPVIGLGMGMGLFNGVFASILTIGTLPFLETAFGITTSVKLLELSNPGHPLMKRLMVEAPGTYHHSILVGNLAEAAADAVGADSLLVRVGSYFHDIGKVKRPYFFIENQPSVENPHDKITPTLSTLIITSHVKDGVELAKEHKFPKVIVDIIEQHHGTGLVSYFYHKAKEGDKPESVLESDFRYQTPRPQNRETAIIMLADSVEAAVHVLEKPTKGHLEAKVREIIKQKLDDGQLSECDLTFKDIAVITQTFVRVLNGMFHSRIEYPDQVAKEMERGKAKGGVNHKEPAGQSDSNPGDGRAS